MKRPIFILFFCFAFNSNSFCQDWVPVITKFTDNPLSCIYNDTTTGDLIFGGLFTVFDSIPTYSIARLKNGIADTFRSGLKFRKYNTGASVTNICRYYNAIYAAGYFDSYIYGPDSVYSIARWDGINWNPVFKCFPYNVLGLNVIDDTLFMVGLFDTVNSQYCSGILAYVEGQGVVKCYGGFYQENNYINNIIKYKNQLYAYGLIVDTLSDLAIGRWNGSYWERVGSAFSQDKYAVVGNAVEYQGDLYVCGGFSKADGDPGDNIMRWDGSQWQEVGGGLDNQAGAMAIHNGLLYVGGAFTHAGGINTGSIAVWDGNQWHSIGDSIFNYDGISSITFYNDQLYAIGDFTKVGSDSIKFVAKYNQPLNTTERIINATSICIYPNPTTDKLFFKNQINGELKCEIFNEVGINFFNSFLFTSDNIDVSKFPPGIYFICLTETNGYIRSGKFIKE